MRHKASNKASQRDSQTAARFVCPCWRRYVKSLNG